MVGGFAHWPWNLELDVSGPGRVLGLCHLSQTSLMGLGRQAGMSAND